MKFTGFSRNIAVLSATALFVAACSDKPEPEVDTSGSDIVEERPVEPEMTAPVDPKIEALALGATGEGMMAYVGGDRVLFDYDSSELDAGAMATLQEVAVWLGEVGNASLLIEGHCDERGTRDYNLALGDRRAVAIRDYLISMGVSSDQLDTISYGKERPVMIGSSNASHRENRRGMIVVQ